MVPKETVNKLLKHSEELDKKNDAFPTAGELDMALDQHVVFPIQMKAYRRAAQRVTDAAARGDSDATLGDSTGDSLKETGEMAPDSLISKASTGQTPLYNTIGVKDPNGSSPSDQLKVQVGVTTGGVLKWWVAKGAAVMETVKKDISVTLHDELKKKGQEINETVMDVAKETV